MSKIRQILAPGMNEAAYKGNIGFEELVKFYQVASTPEVRLMEAIIASNNWDEFKKMIKKVLNKDLK